MTAGEVITKVRFNLGDPEPTAPDTPRYPDAELLGSVNRAGRWLMGKYSESRLADDGTLLTWADAATTAVTLVLSDFYREALIHGATAIAYESDASDKHDREMAAYHRSQVDVFFRPAG